MTTEGAAPAMEPDTVTFLYEYVKDIPVQQIQNARQLDNKIVQVFAASGVAIGLLGFSRGGPSNGMAVTILLTIAVIAYLGVGVCTWRHMQPRDYAAPTSPENAWNTFWADSRLDTQHSMILNISKAYEHNQPLLVEKVRLLRWALRSAAIEFAAIGLAVLAGRWA